MSRGHKRGSGQRSGLYSESKFTNWRKFNPFDAEVNILPYDIKPDLVFETELGDKISIVVRDLHSKFMRPFAVEDVRDTLLRVPPEFLARLETIYLLGGTSKQDKVAFGNLFRYGCYWYCRIALHAFPQRLLSERYSKLPAPDIMQEYERAGATWTHDKEGWLFQFKPETLRAFYLYDVLLHEVGHHVDRRNIEKSTKDAERYANWFTTFCRQEMTRAAYATNTG